jgi:hypothetical protein
MEERSVDPFISLTLVGAQAWPTHLSSSMPKPYARQTLLEADLNPYAENGDAFLAQGRRARTGLFQPFGKDEVILFSGFNGGGERGGPAPDPDGILYVNLNKMAWVASMSDAPQESELEKISLGRLLYTQYCVACHGLERKGSFGSAPFWPLHLRPRASIRRKEDSSSWLLVVGRSPGPQRDTVMLRSPCPSEVSSHAPWRACDTGKGKIGRDRDC